MNTRFTKRIAYMEAREIRLTPKESARIWVLYFVRKYGVVPRRNEFRRQYQVNQCTAVRNALIAAGAVGLISVSELS